MAALENLDPAVRIESILDGEDIAPATRLEYFLAKAAEGGGSGTGDFVLFLKATGTVYSMDIENSTVHLAAVDKDATEIDAAAAVKPVFVCFPDILKFTNANNPIISYESSHTYQATDFKNSHYSLDVDVDNTKFRLAYNPPISQLQNMYVIAMQVDR